MTRTLAALVAILAALPLLPSAHAGFVEPHQDESYVARSIDINDAAASSIMVRRHFTVNQTQQAYVWFDQWTSDSVAKGFQVAFTFGPADSAGAPSMVLLSNANVHNTDTSPTATIYAFTTYVLQYTVTLPQPNQRTSSTSSFVGIVALKEGQGTGGSGGVLDPSIGTRLDVTFTGAAPSPTPPPPPQTPPPQQNATMPPPRSGPDCDLQADGDGDWRCAGDPPEAGGYQSPCVELNATIDQDRDGLPDQWEMDNFRSLAETAQGDFDGDGYSNCSEYLAGSDPANPRFTPADKDGDGLPDACEMRYWNRLGVNGNADDDGDGFTNRVECLLGSNPRDAASIPTGVATRKESAPPAPAPTNTTSPPPVIRITNQFQMPAWAVALLIAIAILSLFGLAAGRRRRRDHEPQSALAVRPPPPDEGPFLLRSDPFWDTGPTRKL